MTLAALDLEDVVLVGNDTGGVVTQLVAVHHPERLGALVLTSCDAFEHFPPPILKPVIMAAKSKTMFRTVAQAMRVPVARKRAFDGLAHRNIDALTEEWVRPGLSDPAIAEDLRQFTLSLRTEVTTGVAARLHEFDKPALIAWSADDVFFELADGERLAATDPQRPPRGHRGSADVLDGGPARPAGRPAVDDRGARVGSPRWRVTPQALADSVSAMSDATAPLHGRRILVTGGRPVSVRPPSESSPRPGATGRRHLSPDAAAGWSRRDLAAVRCA